MKKVFIDGSAGTTGLRIRERLESRKDLQVVVLPEELRKDTEARRAALNESDVAFLCLPDAAAIEAVAMVENPDTVVIDTSTAHRCADGWRYGFPEIMHPALASRSGYNGGGESSLYGERPASQIIVRRVTHEPRRIANPGCHASGFNALVAPLVKAGLIDRSAALCAFSLTGYSGGGKKMISAYEEELEKKVGVGEIPLSHSHSELPLFYGGRQYALGQGHKHLPEMMKYCGLEKAPVFSPIVVPHLSGMEVTVQIQVKSKGEKVKSAEGFLSSIKECYREFYGVAGEKRPGVVRFAETLDDGGFISSAALSGRDDMLVGAYGNDERIILVSLFDNLGKGASGAAIQNMNLALGCEETEGLKIG